MRIGFLMLSVALAGCGGKTESTSDLMAETAMEASAVAPAAALADAVEMMTDAEANYCQSVGRIQVEEDIRSRVPEWAGTASVLPGTQQFVLSPASNMHGATHLMVCRVRIYRDSGTEVIQIWGVYCTGGKPIAAKNLFLGEYPG